MPAKPELFLPAQVVDVTGFGEVGSFSLISNAYYRWSKEFLKTGKKRLSAVTAREAIYCPANQGFDTNQHNRCVT